MVELTRGVIRVPRSPKIAIDGPAGSGKSTVAKAVAGKLNFLYVNTGAMYRAVAYLALKSSHDFNDEAVIAALAGRVKFSFVHYLKNNSFSLWCDGENVTPYLRTQEVSREVARVASIPQVRYYLVNYQRLLARNGAVVMEGRDIGTFVLPDAEYKFFLTADLDVRLARREQELRILGCTIDREELRREFIFRDKMDLKREVGPLKIAPDAVVIDCTELTIEEVVTKILGICGGG